MTVSRLLLPLSALVSRNHVIQLEGAQFRTLESTSCRVVDEGRSEDPSFLGPMQMDVDVESGKHVPEVPFRCGVLQT